MIELTTLKWSWKLNNSKTIIINYNFGQILLFLIDMLRLYCYMYMFYKYIVIVVVVVNSILYGIKPTWHTKSLIL